MHNNTEHTGPAAGRHGTRAAALGTAIQGALAFAVLGLCASTGTDAMLALSLHSAAGLLPWACIWVLSHFQRQRAVELLERDREMPGADTAIFRDDADARPAARRFRQACRWGLPAVSTLTGACLLGIGVTLLRRVPAAREVQSITAGHAALAAGASFIAFVAGRYLLGMSQSRPWQLLRGGASYLLGCVLLLFLSSLALAGTHFGVSLPLRLLAKAIPIVSIVIGTEFLFNQLLDLYRPRQKDEMPRPAFDSRLLSLLASPRGIVQTLNEAVNYQFGFEITRSWFWRLLTRAFGWLILTGVLVLLAVSCIIIVEPHRQALVVRFGRIVGGPLEPGIHLKLPWPVSVTEHYDISRIRSLTIGSHDKTWEDRPLLWSNQHSIGPERLLMLAPSKDMTDMISAGPATAPADASRAPAITLAGADIFIQYRIADVADYARNHVDPERRFVQIAEQEASRYLLRLDIDEAIGVTRSQAASELQAILRQATRRERLGLDVVWVGLAGIHPAQQAADAFYETVGAEQEKQASVHSAMRDATKVLAEAAGTEARCTAILAAIEQFESQAVRNAPAADQRSQETRVEALIHAAGGKAAEAIADARAYRWRVENAERGRAARFVGELAGFSAAPLLYRARRHLETLAEGMSAGRKYLLVTDRADLVIRGDLKDTTTTLDST